MQEPAQEPTPLSPLREANDGVLYAAAYQKQQVFLCRHNSEQVLVVDEDKKECFLLKWKTFNKMQRKGRELDPRFFNEHERKEFTKADAKEWQSFLGTGAAEIVPPKEASNVPQSRIFQRPLRYVRTNKSDKENELIAKSRMVTPGDVDPDGDIPVEAGGFRTDAPTCPQVAFHLLCSCLLYTSPSPRDKRQSRMPSSA